MENFKNTTEEKIISAIRMKESAGLPLSLEKDLLDLLMSPSNKWSLSEELVDLMLEKDVLTPVLWFGDQWIPPRKNIDWALNQKSQQKEFVWACRKWTPTSADIELGLKDENKQILNIILSRPDIKLSHNQVDFILDSDIYAIKSALWKNHALVFIPTETQVDLCLKDRHLIDAVMSNPNFKPTFDQINKGLSGGYPELDKDSLSSWECFRAKLESSLLHQRVDIKQSQQIPKVL